MILHRRLMPPLVAVALLVTACSNGSSPSRSAGPIESASASTPQPSDDTSVIDAWRANATMHRGMNGERFEYECPPGGEPGPVWGTDIYTDDSSVCTAAVHVGLITLEDGGTVTIEIAPGEDAYESSERHGVEASPYGPWGGSFTVLATSG